MVGTLCGDAYGAPVEWYSPAHVAEYFEKNGREFRDYLNPWHIKRGKPPSTIKGGQPTDDSELAAALAESLIISKGLDCEDLYMRLRKFIHDRKTILSPTAFGSGGTLRAALAYPTHIESQMRFDMGEIPTPPSNGSLMRNVAIPLFYSERPFNTQIHRAKEQSMVTHQNTESVAACMLHSLYVEMILNGLSPSEAWARAKQLLPLVQKIDLELFETVLAIEPTKPEYESEMKGKEGYSVLSLRVAAWASIEATDFADGITKSISVGGDTDTYGAIAGGILGAHFGIQGIPKDWQNALQGRDKMIELADQLYNSAYS
jgi:ADP-ribosyl-[dinitrogen reductase] hydrolase